MTAIVIRRPAALWQDRARNYRIIIDGNDAGTIANKGETRIALPPGRHTVRLKIDWCGSPEIVVDVGPGTEHVLECGPNSNIFLAVLHLTIWKGEYLWLRDLGVRALPAAAMA
jgi:hypothetical protein